MKQTKKLKSGVVIIRSNNSEWQFILIEGLVIKQNHTRDNIPNVTRCER